MRRELNMRAALSKPLLPLAAALVLVAGCAETKTKISRVDLKVNLKACLGDAEGNVQIGNQNIKSTCRDELVSRVPDLPVNACLILVDTQADGTPAYYVPLKWKDGALSPTDPSKLDLDLTVGHKIRSEFYFFGEGATAELCGGANSIPPGNEQPGEYKCDADQFCLFKLVQTDVNFSEGGTIDFKGKDGACNSVWRQDVEGTLETCDGQDNDCDGVKDDNIQDAEGNKIGEACSLGQGDCEANGRYVCKDGGVACNAVPKRPGVERCDGRDNDCNGIDDDGTPEDCCGRDPGDQTQGERGACGAGVGVCVIGERQCQIADGEARGTWGPCIDPATTMPVIEVGAQAEVCDNLDNDCNGTVNDDFDVGATCEDGVGACKTQGTKICMADGSGTMCSAVPGQGGAEVCDGIDNDCDMETDEGFSLGEPCAEGQGACEVAGTRRCEPGNVMGTICADAAGVRVVPSAPQLELCGDEIDSDCDGHDSNGYETIGEACQAGLGLCLRAGANVCEPVQRRTVVCGAVVGPSVDETCDLQDNDCDGQTDEDFDTDTDPDNCGSCNHPCELDNAVPDCAAGQCRIQSCLAPFEDYDHQIENGCECNRGAVDVPDPDFIDSNCDDVDGDRQQAFFVSAAAGHDSNEVPPGDGSLANPFRTLPAAIQVANQVNRPILLDAGEYVVDSTLVVPAGVRIHGGYRYNQNLAQWSRAARNINETRITGTNIVLRYRDLDRETLLDNVVVVATNARTETHASIGIHVINGGDFLTLRDVEVRAGQGGPGRAGNNGSQSVGAVVGSPGANTNAVRPGVGGVGGTNPRCLMENTGGGVGGDGARSASANVAATAGTAGQGADAANGAGGPGGADDQPGRQGLTGRSGTNGSNSGPANAEGMVLDLNVQNGPVIPLVWQPRQSQAAMNGTAGTGGGGGGGGGGATGLANSQGGGGGGGGAGGCGGQGGDGAYGGGGSFGLFLVGGHVKVINSRISSAAGGDGGDGGDGAPGESGAAGGSGGLKAAACASCGVGGPGGDGGPGGCGGHAGGGAGGPSFAVFRVAPPGRDANNALFTVAESTVVFTDYDGTVLDFGAVEVMSLFPGQAGIGGGGGTRVNCGDPAADGADGVAGTIGCCRRSGAAGTTCGELGVCD
jgi:hypothetical protein